MAAAAMGSSPSLTYTAGHAITKSSSAVKTPASVAALRTPPFVGTESELPAWGLRPQRHLVSLQSNLRGSGVSQSNDCAGLGKALWFHDPVGMVSVHNLGPGGFLWWTWTTGTLCHIPQQGQRTAARAGKGLRQGPRARRREDRSAGPRQGRRLLLQPRRGPGPEGMLLSYCVGFPEGS